MNDQPTTPTEPPIRSAADYKSMLRHVMEVDMDDWRDALLQSISELRAL